MTIVAGCASSSAARSTGQPAASPMVTCSLLAQDCGDALQAIEGLPALDPAGMPPIAVQIVNMLECPAISGAPEGYSPCAAAMNPPADLNATGAGDAVASVTYRNGLGKAFLWLFWRTYPSGRG